MADSLRSLFENTSNDPRSLHRLRERIAQIVSDTIARGEDPGANLSLEQSRSLIESLPRLSEDQIRDLGHHDSLCPICYTPFAAILAEEETALAIDDFAVDEELGVTKLAAPWQCGHVFCRRDISKWIRGGHGSCPMCRRTLLESSTSDSSDPASTQEPATSPQDAELLTQIRTYMEELFSNGAVAYVDHDGDFRGFGDPIYVPEGGYDDDRSEFSGMYS